MNVEKDESFRSKSIKKAIFSSFNFDMGNVGFYTLLEAKVLVEKWRREYNHVRPHSALGYLPPAPEAILPKDGPSGSLLFGSATIHLTTKRAG